MHHSFHICYVTFGNPNNSCIILIRGLGGQLIDWPSSFIQGLVEKSFYVVIFDNRDSGLSRQYEELGVPNFNEVIAAKQEGKTYKPPYTLEDLASDVIDLMNELSISKAHIVGLSMGGIVAQYIALNFRDRVLSLTCIASTSGDPHLPPAKKEILEYFANSMNANAQNQSLESSINNKLQLFKLYDHPDFFDEEKTRHQITTAIQRANYPPGFQRLILAMLSAEPRTAKLKNIKIPALIIHGDYNPLFPIEHGKQLAESLPGSHLEIIEKMGHGLPDFASNKIVDLIAKYFK